MRWQRKEIFPLSYSYGKTCATETFFVQSSDKYLTKKYTNCVEESIKEAKISVLSRILVLKFLIL